MAARTATKAAPKKAASKAKVVKGGKVVASKFLGARTYKGNVLPLPRGTVRKGNDPQGRILYQNAALKRWYAAEPVPGGWVVFEYEGDCGCGG